MSTIPSPLPFAAPLVGVASAQVCPANPTRSALFVYNPSLTATIAISPTGLAAVINGAGSITLPPGVGIELDGFTTALLAIATAASTPITVWEFY